jgi:hypothetical protein
VAEVVDLYKSNFRHPAATLRVIADEIDAGKYGEVGCVGVVVLGDELVVFGAGVDSEGPSVHALLHAGAATLIQPMIDRAR